MTIKVIFERENPLFKRKEISLAFEAKITPSKKDAMKLIADQFKVKEERIRLRKVEGSFGSNIFKIIGDVYDSKEDLNRIVKRTKQEIDAEKKAKLDALKAEEEAKEAKKAEKEAAAAAKVEAAEKPKEEVKEEAAKEEVKGEDK